MPYGFITMLQPSACGGIELILAERGDHGYPREHPAGVSLRVRGQLPAKLRRRRPKPGDIWHLDVGSSCGSTVVLHYLWNAVD